MTTRFSLKSASGRVVGRSEFCAMLKPGGLVRVYYPDDPGIWHERLLLYPVTAQVWVIYTPDGDLYSENLACADH